MSLDLFIVPGENWANGEVIEATLGGLRGHLIEKISFSPVLVHKHNRLGRAFLTRVSVGILIALPGNVINLFLVFGCVGTKDFPIISTVFKLDFTVQHFSEMLTNS